MNRMNRHILSAIGCLFCLITFASERHWMTHFAYNSVQQIAFTEDEVYAQANGKLFSVDPTTEKLTKYTNYSGMHGKDIAQLAFDATRNQMLIMYTDGKMDIWHANKNMQYISDLYNKQMTSSKKCNNITIHNDMAYLSMDFGILTFNLENYEIIDTYYIGHEASEISVQDVLILGDSIYAKSTDSIYAAHLKDNIVDYRYWKSSKSATVPFDSKKGQEYISAKGDIWRAAGTKGIEREFATKSKSYYLPDGPAMNIPYSLSHSNDRLYMVPGGRWTAQNLTAGCVMIYENGKWKNITSSEIYNTTQKSVLDFTNVAINPDNPKHYFVSSFGTGLYEFKDDKLVNHYTPSNSIFGSVIKENPEYYTRIEAPMFDSEGRLWVIVAGSNIDTTLVSFDTDGSQRGLNIFPSGVRRLINTPGNMLQDRVKKNRKWIISCRTEASVILLDDGGTKFDSSDDQCISLTEFTDQDGKIIKPEFFFTVAQAPNGDIWIGSSAGPIIIPKDIDMLKTNDCLRLRIKMEDESYLLEKDRVNAFAWDSNGQLWIGSQSGGVYVLDADAKQVVACYTSNNSTMPTNTVLSLAWNANKSQMFIGTSAGLVSYLEDPDIFAQHDLEEQDWVEDDRYSYGNMFRWRVHNAFTQVEEIAQMGDKIFGISAQSLFSVDKRTNLVSTYSKLDGLSGSNIDHIAYNTHLNRLLITYSNGQLDILTPDNDIYNIPDLYLKQMTSSKQVNDIYMDGEKAYLAMSFGIIVINMRKAEIEDTYYIGNGSSEVDVKYICLSGSTIYAAAANQLYYADTQTNLVDYAHWNTQQLPSSKNILGMRAWNNNLYIVLDNKLYKQSGSQWIYTNVNAITGLSLTNDELFVHTIARYGVGKINANDNVTWMIKNRLYTSIIKDGNAYWLGSNIDGLIRYTIDSNTDKEYEEKYAPNGPASNFSYKIQYLGDKLYMVPGGRWANEFQRPGNIMIFEDNEWRNIKYQELKEMARKVLGRNHEVWDLMNVVEDPKDPNHYFVSSYGTGLYEILNDSLVYIYLPENSKIQSAVPEFPDIYTRTDGMTYDDMGNLWIINLGKECDNNMHVVTPEGEWHSFNLYYNKKRLDMVTVGEIMIDKRNPQWKWIPLMRHNTGLILLQDNGSPTDSSDDIVTYRTEWIDQYNYQILPSNIYTIAQDRNNVVWVGTDAGMFLIPSDVDFTQSNSCKRVIIPRNDGTDLVDFLLENEQINDIKIDGANRIWVATATSGVILLKPTLEDVNDPLYSVETIAHFTSENSVLPSNNVLSIAIQASTGEVFFATSAGLVSYMSDATPPQEDYNELYVYPNPVYPTYRGYITFKGLAENTDVRIIDPNGHLVVTVTSEGGTAIWDGKNSRGERVASGVYTGICNTKDGKIHSSVKVLILH